MRTPSFGPSRSVILLFAVAFLVVSCGTSSDEGLGVVTDDRTAGTDTTDPAGPDDGGPGPDPVDTGDADQDGVFDGDNCPGLFNPDQADDDADGIGNPCDDRVDPTIDCAIGGSLTQEAAASGDRTLTTICQPLMQEGSPVDLAVLGDVLIVDDHYLIVDLTPAALAEARELGLETVVTETIAGLRAADLAALRIERDPEVALSTADPDVLAAIDAEVLGRVPPDVLAAQPDRVLAAIDEEFWVAAPTATLEIVGRERLALIHPQLQPFELDLVPDIDGPRLDGDRLRLPDPSMTTPTTVTTTLADDSDG